MVDALDRGGKKAKELYFLLRRKIETFEKCDGRLFEEKIMKYWVSLRDRKKGKVFAEIRLSKDKLDVFILPMQSQLIDPHDLTFPVPPNQGWGWFRTRFWVENEDQVEACFRLIRQSYEIA